MKSTGVKCRHRETKYQTTPHCDNVLLLKSRGADVARNTDTNNEDNYLQSHQKVLKSILETKQKVPEVTHKQFRSDTPQGCPVILVSYFYFSGSYFIKEIKLKRSTKISNKNLSSCVIII